MSNFNFATALQNAIADPSSYVSFRKEASDRAFEQIYSSFSGKNVFRAVVLPKDLNSDVTDRLTAAIRVRPLELDGFIIPEPCEGICVESKRMILAMHPVAYPASSTPATHPPSIESGDIVLCAFEGDGPARTGRMRGLVYYPASLQRSPIEFRCLNSTASTGGRGRSRRRRTRSPEAERRADDRRYEASRQIDGLSYDELPDADSDNVVDEPAGSVVANASAKGFDWETLKKLGSYPHFDIIKGAIYAEESGGNYDIFNLTSSEVGKGGGTGSTRLFKEYFGKSLSELKIQTMKEVVYQKKVFTNLQDKPARVQAAGSYQIIKKTFLEAYGGIKNLNTDEKFGKIQQEAFGIFLMFMKQPKLGSYLVGKSDDVHAAQLQLAQEWAGIRISKAHLRTEYGPRLQLQKGDSFYKGIGGNPNSRNVALADEITNAIKNQRKKIKDIMESDAEFKSLIESYKS